MDDVYDVERTVAAIRAGAYERVALQFPDELLADAVAVVARLQEREPRPSYFVMADTTFGSYDVDEVAADHVNADLVVHYGPAALGATTRLPVLFVFKRAPIDVDDCAAAAVRLLAVDGQDPLHLLVMADFAYVHAHEGAPTGTAAVAARLRATGRFGHVVAAETVDGWRLNGTAPSAGQPFAGQPGRRYTLAEGTALAQYHIWYLGPESATLTNILLTHPRNQVSTYDADARTARRETADVNRMLRRRRYLVQQTKEANVIGIVVTALGVEGFLDVATNLKRLVRAVGKRAFTFVMGKLNVTKMANFMEVDVFVLVASPENSLIDTRDFIKPVVTPYDAWVALATDGTAAGTELVTDFQQLQAALQAAATAAEAAGRSGARGDRAPIYSFVSGTYRSEAAPELGSIENDVDGAAVAVRNTATALTSYTAPDYLAGRTFRGLEQRLGATPVVLAVEGLDGIARGYSGEPRDAVP